MSIRHDREEEFRSLMKFQQGYSSDEAGSGKEYRLLVSEHLQAGHFIMDEKFDTIQDAKEFASDIDMASIYIIDIKCEV